MFGSLCGPAVLVPSPRPANGIPTVSPQAVNKLAERATNAVLKRYDIDHFQSFHGHVPARIAADQTGWLKRTLLKSPA